MDVRGKPRCIIVLLTLTNNPKPQHGAKHLVLTSRSGPDSLRSRGDFIGKRILDYLQGRDDLVLQACAASATSVEQLESILRKTSVPLGGAVILSALLNDRPFASQNQENFDSVFPPKVDAFTTLTRAVDIASLDFCITFSSISGMFGNPGQTSYAAYVVFPVHVVDLTDCNAEPTRHSREQYAATGTRSRSSLLSF